jgi:acetolactate decarboxylase
MYGCHKNHEKRDVLFQISTTNALLEGLYDGNVTIGELKEHGDIGLGTFHELDGEMVLVDGVCYRITSDGTAQPASNSAKTPFAEVTFFDTDKFMHQDTGMNLDQFNGYIDSVATLKNIFCVIRADGLFKYVKTRSVPKQKKPYLRLINVVEKQPVFEFRHIRGTIVGFRLPEFMKNINVPGYHLHFITEDKKAGGHVLAMETGDIQIRLDYTSELNVSLSESEEFSALKSTGDLSNELEKIEK